MGRMADKERRHILHPLSLWGSLRARPRVIAAVCAGVAVLVLLPASVNGSVRAAIAWIAAALVYICGAGYTMATADHKSIAMRAAEEDESRTVMLALLLVAISANFVSIVGVMSRAKEATGGERAGLVVLAAATLIASWFVMQVVFAFHYAHEYYRPDDASGQHAHGLAFVDDEEPDYWDFLYFATSIGAASQTADVAIRSRTMRRLVTAQAIVSFFYNSALLALTINLAASLI